MEERFKVKVDSSTLRLAALATLSVGGCTKVFLGWAKRLGNPPYLFYVPLERESTRTS